MDRNPVGWFEIYVRDMPRAKAFYEAVLGVTLKKLESPAAGVPEMWAFPMFESGAGAAGALAKMDGLPDGVGTIVYFSCTDCAIEAARAEAAGGKMKKAKFAIGSWGHIALVSDTEGNVIGLHSRD